MAICDVKASSIDNAISAMEGAIRLLKEHRIKVLLYKDTADDVKNLLKGINTRVMALQINTESYGSAVRELMTETMAAMPSAPEKRTIGCRVLTNASTL